MLTRKSGTISASTVHDFDGSANLRGNHLRLPQGPHASSRDPPKTLNLPQPSRGLVPTHENLGRQLNLSCSAVRFAPPACRDEYGAGRSVARQLTLCRVCFTLDAVIVSFRHPGLRELFETGKSRKVQPNLHKRCRRAMDALHAATALSDLNMPGWSVHPLKGNREGRHAMAVSGPWRITFRWDGKDAHELTLEQYH